MTPIKNPLRLAIVGVNNQGIDHLESIQRCDDVILTALCDQNPEILHETARRFDLQDVHLDTSLEKTCARHDVDALIIALPHHLHPFAVDEAVKAKKHLLKEKPLARTLSEAHQLAQKARQAGLILHTGVQRRHHSTYRFLKERLQDRQIHSASLQMTIAVAPAPSGSHPRTWRDDFQKSGGGALIDLGYHAVDLLHFLLGPMEVLSCVTTKNGLPSPAQTVEDDAKIWALAGPVWAYIHVGRSDQKREKLIIDTDQGRFIADREEVTLIHPQRQKKLLHRAERSWAETMKAQFSTLASAIRTGEQGKNDLHEQIPTMRFIEKCYARRIDQGFFLPDGAEIS